jgi:hypothetical protein
MRPHPTEHGIFPLILVDEDSILPGGHLLISVQGHSHARKALHETHKSNAIAASEEHDLAAGEFANAAKNTRDAEVEPNQCFLSLRPS